MSTTRATSPIVSAPLTEQIESEVTRMITSRILEPGARIKETELAEMFGTSRIPVREALRQLSERGLVVYLQRRGYYVRELTFEQARDIFALRFALDRLAIEQAASRPSARNFGDRLPPLLAEMSAAIEARDVARVIEADLQFHRAVAESSGNEALIEIYSHVTDPIRPALIRMVPDELDANLLAQHQRIAKAIRPGGMRDAVAALKAHNEFALALLQTLISRDQQAEGVADQEVS
jgi:DNA-binding GntR family transcriptional regulator